MEKQLWNLTKSLTKSSLIENIKKQSASLQLA